MRTERRGRGQTALRKDCFLLVVAKIDVVVAAGGAEVLVSKRFKVIEISPALCTAVEK